MDDFDDLVGTDSYAEFRDKCLQKEEYKTLLEALKGIPEPGMTPEEDLEQYIRIDYEEYINGRYPTQKN